MFSNHFRQLLVLGLLVGLVTAVTALNTAVTAQSPQLPPTPEERMLIPHLPADENAPIVAQTVLGDGLPSWSKGVFQSFRDDNWEIYRSDYNVPNAVRLTVHDSTDMHPRLNRGATRIVFSSNRDGDYEIFTMNADGSGLQQLTHNDTIDVNPAWSPDGHLIVFQAYRDGQPEVYVMNANGSNETRLTTNAAYDGDPVWSPDGSKIAFRSSRLGTPFIYVMNSDGTGVAQLSGQPSYYVAWSPDGSQIAYTADLDGDDFFEMWLMNADGSDQHMIYDPYYQQADAWVRDWSPDGREITFTLINFIQYQGNWYWEWAYIEGYDLATGNISSLDGTGREWNPDWQTTDVTPPQTELASLSSFSQTPDFTLYWSGADQQSGAGLATFDVQYRVGYTGSWVDWQMGTTETSAAYTAVPGTTVSFRTRARDNAFNVEEWSLPNTQTTTFYTWSLGGKLTDNRGAPLPQAPLSISPLPINQARTDQEGNFFSWLKMEGSHNIDVNRSGYGDLAQTSLNMENLAHIYLPPANSALLNGDFEAAAPLSNWMTTGTVTAVTNPHHTGTKSAWLGNTTCSYPCLTAGEGTNFFALYPDMAADSQGIVHFVNSGQNGEIVYTNRLPDGTWSPTEVIGSNGGNPPRLAIDRNDDLHVLWSFNNQIYYAYKSSIGSWSTPEVVATFAQEYSVIGWVADSQGGLHSFVERGLYTSDFGAYYLQRQPDGTWQTPVLLASSENGVTYRNGLMAIGPDDTLHFVWAKRYIDSPSIFKLIYQQRLSDGTWTGKINIPMPVIGDIYEIFTESMATAPDGTLHFIWSGNIAGSSRHTFHSIRTANGVWSDPTVIYQQENSLIRDLHLSIDNLGNIHTAYAAEENYSSYYYYRLWRPGSGWQPPVFLGNQDYYNFEPRTAVDPYDIVHIMTPDQNGIYFRYLPATSNSTAVLSQQVTIPANMPAPTLAFMAQRPGDVPGDGSGLELLVSDGVTTTAVPLANGGAAWTHYWADMSPWAGQTVTVLFQLTQESGDPRVRAAIDDVTLGSAYPDTWVSGTSPGAALPGETVVFRVQYGNNGRVPAIDGELMMSWPASLTFISASVTPTVGVDTLTWNVGDLAAESEPGTIVVTATVDLSIAYFETIDLPVSLSSATFEVEQQNNEVTLTLLIAHRAFLPVIYKP